MKNIHFRSLSFLFIIPLFFGAKSDLKAQTAEKGLLWEISGKGIKKSYLYGTIHIQDKKVFAYDPVVEAKLKSCKAFAMELVLDEINQMELAKSMMMLDYSLDQLITPEEYRLVAAKFKEQTGMELSTMNHVKPFMVYAQMSQGDLPQDMPVPLDMHLLKIARANKQKVMAVEQLSEQMAAINSISVKDQAQMLVKMIGDTAKGGAEFLGLVNTYLSQDLGKMVALTEDPSMPKEIAEQFLNARNKVMAERVEGFIKDQSTFTAVGAAHLGGTNGVLELLKQKGYALKAVPFNFKH